MITPPYNLYLPVTPDNAVNFLMPSQALYIGVTGDVDAVMQNGTATTFVGVPAGSLLPIKAIRVNAALTTATSLVTLNTV